MSEEVYVFPMSYAQQRLWFLQRLDPAATVYHISHGIRLSGDLHADALERALVAIVERHEVLRTTFDLIDGEASQVIDDRVDAILNRHDLREMEKDDQQKAVRKLAASQRDEPFDLKKGPLLRLALLSLDDREHILLLTVHHIVFDGWSMSIFLDELMHLYQGFKSGVEPTLPDLEIQYADFAAWQAEYLDQDRMQQQVGYWRDRLKDVSQRLELPTDKKRPAQQTFRGAMVPFHLSEPLCNATRQLSQQQDATLFMTLLSAYALLLHRYTGQRELVIGTPVAGRVRQELEPLIGFFVNTLPLRVDIDPEMSFAQLVQHVRQSSLDAFAHQEAPFEKIVEALTPERDLSHTPLFQTSFALQNAPVGELRMENLEIDALELEQVTAKFDLSLLVREAGEALVGGVEYNSDIFDAVTAERIGCHFRRLLQQAVDQPDAPMCKLDMLELQEKQRILREWNDTAPDYPEKTSIAALFEERVRECPQNAAALYNGNELTYEELNRRANRLAHHLLSQGICPGQLVGLCLPPSLEMIVAMVAALKAGGAYLPLDMDSPRDRLALIIEDSSPTFILCDRQSRALLPDPGEATVLDLDLFSFDPGQGPETNPEIALGGECPAYVIYTSGSTGRPKGVVIPQRAVNRLVLNTDYVSVEPGTRVAQAATPAFDAATFEIWAPLLNSGCVVGVPKEVLIDGEALSRFLRRESIDTMFMTTALFNQLADRSPDACASLRCLLFGGEMVDPERVRKILETGPPQRLLHVYGPTETTTFASWHEVRTVDGKALTIPIGRPIANTSLYILDRHLQPLPVGVEGELHIGGPGVALGYLNNEKLTREKFIPNPFGSGFLYRSGDRARFRRDGTVEFIGRADRQLKLRGFRIEPAEIEATLLTMEGVTDAAVVVQEKENTRELVAFVVLSAAEGDDWEDRLREKLKGKLPGYMRPAGYMRLPQLPLNPNQKVDRQALAGMKIGTGRHGGSVPQGETEQILASIWCEVLVLEQVSREQNFFDLGGHSLLATRVMSRIRDQLQVEVPLKVLFEKPDLTALARHIDVLRVTTESAHPDEDEEITL